MKALPLCLLLLCATASAQTWDYTGSMMTGTDTVTTYGQSGPVSTSTPVSEAFSAQFVVSGTTSLTYTLDLGNQVIAAGTTLATGGALGPGYIQPTYANGAINGFTVEIGCDYCNGKENYSFNVTPNGDSYYYLANGESAGFTAVWMTNATAGVWVDPPSAVAAPEIEPTGALGAFLLLAGGLAVVRGRSRGRS